MGVWLGVGVQSNAESLRCRGTAEVPWRYPQWTQGGATTGPTNLSAPDRDLTRAGGKSWRASA